MIACNNGTIRGYFRKFFYYHLAGIINDFKSFTEMNIFIKKNVCWIGNRCWSLQQCSTTKIAKRLAIFGLDKANVYESAKMLDSNKKRKIFFTKLLIFDINCLFIPNTCSFLINDFINLNCEESSIDQINQQHRGYHTQRTNIFT